MLSNHPYVAQHLSKSVKSDCARSASAHGCCTTYDVTSGDIT